MLLKIDVNPEDIICNKNGRIVVMLKRYSQFATGAHICSVDGNSMEDFEKNGAKKCKHIFVGGNGGLSIE